MPTQATTALWERYKKYLIIDDALGFRLDVSRMDFTDAFMADMEPRIQKAFSAMDALEKGAIANPDENRMVGHYWLRNPDLAPDPDIANEIKTTLARIKEFARQVHSGAIRPEKAERFRHLLVIGIGGSALGPEFVAAALARTDNPLTPHFFDNTDPDGMDLVLAQIGDGLKETLTVVISKSGGTKETRNGQLEAREAYTRAGLSFHQHVAAITQVCSDLDKTAVQEGWLARFPMWDWVGGRTSELSAVGLLPAALQGIDVFAMLDGAKEMDAVTRVHETAKNPAALMALMWYWAGDGKGKKDMVVLPYKDRLLLFSRYLQQLVMESLGKELDLDGNVVHQGISVYGNKGSTDQHAYVQQLRDGVLNFFVTFIEVLKDREGNSIRVEPDITSGDFLQGFLLGTRRALHEKGRQSITLTLDEVSPRSIGRLIALYERTVGFYGTLVNVNAYHQPGVEAGKKAAGEVIEIVHKIIDFLRANKGRDFSLEELAEATGTSEDIETVYQVAEHLAANTRIHKQETGDPFNPRYA
ncbi:MAG: glucose-6-phosphate isomerase [Armatimonadetes bacterium]|nr:glucose-6-phosphate isomerase [Armatimonadota bacterium]